MIGVDFGDDPAEVEAFGERYEIPFPLAIEDQDRAKKMFGILGCPSTVLIDRKGRIVGRGAGEGDWTGESARALVRSLLGIREATGSASAPTPAAAKKARKAVHLISAVIPNDAKLNEILDESAAALKAGAEVSIVFAARTI